MREHDSEEQAMPIRQELLDNIFCPACKGDVKLTADEQGLKCVQCNRVYPIKEGVPVMLIEEAAIEPEER